MERDRHAPSASSIILVARSTTCSQRGQRHARGADNAILVARSTHARRARGKPQDSLESRWEMVHNVTDRHGVRKPLMLTLNKCQIRRDNNSLNRSAGVGRFWDGQFNPGTRLTKTLSRSNTEVTPTPERQTFERKQHLHFPSAATLGS